MKKLILALAALLALPTAAQAQVQPYVEGTASTDKDYGVAVGLEAPANASGTLRLGTQLGVENAFRNDRDTTFTLSVIPTVKLFGATRLYGEAGGLYTNNELGYRLGAGIKQGLTDRSYLKVGFRHDNYGQGVNGNAGTLSLGMRF